MQRVICRLESLFFLDKLSELDSAILIVYGTQSWSALPQNQTIHSRDQIKSECHGVLIRVPCGIYPESADRI